MNKNIYVYKFNLIELDRYLKSNTKIQSDSIKKNWFFKKQFIWFFIFWSNFWVHNQLIGLWTSPDIIIEIDEVQFS